MNVCVLYVNATIYAVFLVTSTFCPGQLCKHLKERRMLCKHRDGAIYNGIFYCTTIFQCIN